MALPDIDSLLGEISPEHPSGEDLEYDDTMGQMVLASQGTPERGMGEEIQPAEDPDWRKLRDLALDVLIRSRDLRAAIQLARSLVSLDGVTGLEAGLRLTRGLLESQWSTIHPQLDAEDENDPTMRMNIVANLADADSMLSLVRKMALLSARGFGTFGLRDIQLAAGEAQPTEKETVPERAAVAGAFAESPIHDLKATSNAIQVSIEHVVAIEKAFVERVGVDHAPELAALRGILEAAGRILQDQLAARGEASSEGDQGSPSGSAGGGASVGAIGSREDAIRAIDAICAYYDSREPSSPVPLLLRRAKRLAAKSFVQIVKDMAPDAVSQVEIIGGPDAD